MADDVRPFTAAELIERGEDLAKSISAYVTGPNGPHRTGVLPRHDRSDAHIVMLCTTLADALEKIDALRSEIAELRARVID